MDPAIIITSRFPDELVRKLERYATVVQGTDGSTLLDRAAVLASAANAVAIINQNELKIDADLLERAFNLRIVANASAGFDNMDVAAMRRRRIYGCNCPQSFAADTANHTMALLLAVTRRIVEADRYVRSGEWKRDGWMPAGRWDGLALGGKRLGLVGYGNIGQLVAARARTFGMKVHHHTRSRQADGWLPLEELLSQSDIVSLHCPLSEATRHLVNANTLALMKPGAILLNLARGPVVKTDDLVSALDAKRLAGAGLDVFEFEPDVPQALAAMPNVVLSPHMAGCSVEARRDAWKLCTENVVAVLSGERPKTPAFEIG